MIISLIKDSLKHLQDGEFITTPSINNDIEKECHEHINMKLNINNIKNTVDIKTDEDNQIIYEENIYKIYIKIRDIDKGFVLPSLLSIDKIRKFILNEHNHIIFIFINYEKNDLCTIIKNIDVQPIEAIDWDNLSIQNIGKGQLNIKTPSKAMTFNEDCTIKEWIDELKEQVKAYYNRLILKITEYRTEWEDESLDN